MENQDTSFEKKTERLDIRLSHNKKQAFVEACENQGDTPSNAVRRFITTYIRRERRDEIAATIRFSNWKRKLGMGAMALASIAAVVLVWGFATSQSQKNLTAKNFKIYDANQNGVLDVGEIASNDMHLHRVLNIDGVDGISPEEFKLKGKMVWTFVSEAGFEVVEDKQGRFKQTSTITSTVGLSGEALDSDELRFVKIAGEFVAVPKGVSVMDFLKSENVSPGDLDARVDLGELTSEQKSMREKYTSKIVNFDLSNPAKKQINVFRHQTSDLAVSSIDTHHRMVFWIEGRKTPEFVMGSGRDKAVLTKAVSAESG